MKEYIIKVDEDKKDIMGNCPLVEKPQELVRCKDCKHGKQLFEDYVSCQISEENESGCHVSHKPDWFCADGERK